MATTIQISEDLQKALSDKRLFDKETYEEVIWNLIEDNMEINEETKRDIKVSRAEIRNGKVHTLSKIKKELGI